MKEEEEEREGEDEEESLDVGVGWSQTMTLHGRRLIVMLIRWNPLLNRRAKRWLHAQLLNLKRWTMRRLCPVSDRPKDTAENGGRFPSLRSATPLLLGPLGGRRLKSSLKHKRLERKNGTDSVNGGSGMSLLYEIGKMLLPKPASRARRSILHTCLVYVSRKVLSDKGTTPTRNTNTVLSFKVIVWSTKIGRVRSSMTWGAHPLLLRVRGLLISMVVRPVMMS